MIPRPRAVVALVSLAFPLTLLASVADAAEALPPKLSVKANATKLDVGDTFKLTVTVKRGAPRQKVALQQRKGSSWKSVASKKLPKKGATKRVVFTSVPQGAGFFRYRTKLMPLGKVAGATSGTVRLRVIGPVTTPPPHVPVPLKLGLSGAAGLALPQAAPGRSTDGMSAKATASGLQVVTASGSTRAAVTSGTADVRRFLIAPNGKVYVLFNTRVNLADTTVPSWSTGSTGCLLAEFDANGVPTCIDSTLQGINWMPNRNPAIQFDAAGAIYYTGMASTRMVLRRYKDGYTTDLINDNVLLNDFLVQPDGSVVVAGQTNTSNTTWTRRISPSGQLQTLLPTTTMSGIKAFPDGNVYIAYNGRIDRFLTTAGQMDTTPWLSGTQDSPGHQTCPASITCSPYLNRATQTADGRVFALNGMSGGAVLQVYPTVASTPTAGVAAATVLQAVGTDLLLAGTNSSGAHVLSAVDASGAERVLVGPGNEIEIYHLSPLDADTVWFDGLRFADNRVVVGRIELATGDVTIGSTVDGKWEDFQVFTG